MDSSDWLYDLFVEEALPALDRHSGGSSGSDGEMEYYEGPYEVTPAVKEATLQTSNKVMRRNLTVKSIPISIVSNESGGQTVYIAKE